MSSCACAYSLSCVYNPMDCSPPDFSAHGIFQASILEWVVIFFFRGPPRPRAGTRVSCVSCIGTWEARIDVVCLYNSEFWFSNFRIDKKYLYTRYLDIYILGYIPKFWGPIPWEEIWEPRVESVIFIFSQTSWIILIQAVLRPHFEKLVS